MLELCESLAKNQPPGPKEEIEEPGKEEGNSENSAHCQDHSVVEGVGVVL